MRRISQLGSKADARLMAALGGKRTFPNCEIKEALYGRPSRMALSNHAILAFTRKLHCLGPKASWLEG